MNIKLTCKVAAATRHLILALLFTPLLAAAQYPDKPIKVVIGVAAGAGTDFVARNPIVRKSLTDVGMEVVAGTPEDLAGFHRSDIEVWSSLVRDLKLAPQG